MYLRLFSYRMIKQRIMCCNVCIICVTILALAIESRYVIHFPTVHFQSDYENYYLTSRIVRNSLVDMIQPVYQNEYVTRNTLYISFFNAPSWIDLAGDSEYLKHNCHFDNCIYTRRKENISMMSAVVFSTQNGVNKLDTERFLKERQKDQIWVFFRLEAPTFGNISWYRDPAWRNTMNWSWGYRLDSDIFRPMQALTTRKVIPNKDYRSIFFRKTKMAAWIVSHCKAPSLRDEYVFKLIQSGVSVDIFGLCSDNKIRIDRKILSEKINNEYMFYLSFENSICTDYISEKFYYYLSLDTVLVVRGGLNYSKHFDNKAFIDTSAFQTVKSLAVFMLNVSQNINLYTSYLKHKDKYNIAETKTESMRQSECQLCEKLNNKRFHKKMYSNIETYLHKDTCNNPKVIL